jgi:hypothetical protein
MQKGIPGRNPRNLKYNSKKSTELSEKEIKSLNRETFKEIHDIHLGVSTPITDLYKQ